MQRSMILAFGGASGLLTGLALSPLVLAQETPQPPMAKIIPKELVAHGDVRVDNYYWLNERDEPRVITYLEAENGYTDAMTAHTKALEDALFEEIRGHIRQGDSSVPYRSDDYYYYTRYEEGQQYPIYARKRGSLDAPEEIMLDVNELAEGHGFFAASGRRVSSGQDILAFAEDTVGRRIYTLRFKNLETGEMLPDTVPNVTPSSAWANDNRTIFYIRKDLVTLRGYQVYRHVLGTDASNDMLVYQEPDSTFSMSVWKTKSKAFLMIGSFHTLSTEYRYLNANDPSGEFQVFLPRERDHEYDVDHYHDKFYISTNWEAQNFRLMETPVTDTRKESWREIIPHRDDVLLGSFEIFADFLVVSERKDALRQIRVVPWDDSEEHYLDFGEPAYSASITSFGSDVLNPEFDTPILRYNYSSMTTPSSVYDYNMRTREMTLLKRDEVLGDFDPNNYKTERLYATASDGVRVPISLVYRKGIALDGANPLVLYGYGSYGSSMNASFSSSRLSLLDRGFVYAIAHIRGGQEMGRWWYEDGKLLEKKNTFTDFIACAEHLIEAGYTSSDRLFARGGSAGGLLMGAVVNMRPELFKGVVASVPWVDVVTTMLDASIPLTTFEFDEWGDPNEKEYYDYMLSYSPYDNVTAQDYPNMLVTTGLYDSQVQYFEPAKWVAKLRAVKTDNNVLILKTNMEAGHGGRSGRFRRYREIAFEWAFLLDLAGYREGETH